VVGTAVVGRAVVGRAVGVGRDARTGRAVDVGEEDGELVGIGVEFVGRVVAAGVGVADGALVGLMAVGAASLGEGPLGEGTGRADPC
jgi:hypothetical protein